MNPFADAAKYIRDNHKGYGWVTEWTMRRERKLGRIGYNGKRRLRSIGPEHCDKWVEKQTVNA